VEDPRKPSNLENQNQDDTEYTERRFK